MRQAPQTAVLSPAKATPVAARVANVRPQSASVSVMSVSKNSDDISVSKLRPKVTSSALPFRDALNSSLLPCWQSPPPLSLSVFGYCFLSGHPRVVILCTVDTAAPRLFFLPFGHLRRLLSWHKYGPHRLTLTPLNLPSVLMAHASCLSVAVLYCAAAAGDRARGHDGYRGVQAVGKR